MAWKKNCRKNYKKHLRSNNYEVCRAIARCFPDTGILGVMVFENINLFEDKIGRPPLWSNDSVIRRLHRLSAVYISTTRQLQFHMYIGLRSVYNFSDKMTWFAFYRVLWTEFNACQSTNLKRRWLDLFCNHYHIQCVCNHSTSLVVIFVWLKSFILPHFWHIQDFIVNLDTTP
jgi:hypothetical protein